MNKFGHVSSWKFGASDFGEGKGNVENVNLESDER